MVLHRFIVVGLLLALAGCRTPSSYEGADFSASAQCHMQCQAGYRSCMAQDDSIGGRQRSCEQQAAPASDRRCKDVANPELRRACELKAHDCTLRAPMMSCGERRDTCMSSCG
ncbi:TPA: hypothetical protein QDZ75_000023 [Stenotrophomonas maltophilia]|jgi:hypothetical protein|uniref:Lipoprotein n=1 Tax=Stenotrophomonas maltophilia TaxID=40324 RepID=A0A2J0UF07_STEMA|nr:MULTISPECIES: hypothetical protein [Stenotrophomonas]PJL32035.1 hypothetical protein B9Y64_10835 [Stenotrophomonas maltophilia]HDS1136048.1 hypothetical protein [Stenotrophomonas maltophilia]HDS1148362.1 hypothetical protein [Stenotrophomonas maltophilia]HDS1161923.1 hypothetical protein [Stenotrophomonas maltophilia]HEL5401882.1 hypothetical protein [Stenotrophomonas maltophilia]